MQQNTKEWLEMRKNHIGASDAPVIMGDSPWKTPYQLWRGKLDLDPPTQMNAAMKRGHDLEPMARDAYIFETGVPVTPQIEFHSEYKWMMASLDGISKDKSIIVEIKCPGKADHSLAMEGQIPKKYYAQLQHQLAVVNLNMAHYFSFNSEGSHVLLEVHKDEEYIDKMICKEQKFWDCMQSFVPPALTDKDFVSREESEIVECSHRWLDVHQALDKLKQEEEELRKELISMCDDKSSKVGNIKIQKVISKGRIDYSKIEEIKNIDMNKYRKAPTESWRLSLQKEKS